VDSEAFSKRDSLAVKGVAILMMIWHHCFLAGRFEKYQINFWPLTESRVVNIASFCKICVSLFAFVSGYGLYLSYQREKANGTSHWQMAHIVKTLFNYWFVVVLSWLVCAWIDGRPYRVHGFENSIFTGLWNMGIEFFGLFNLTGGPTLNGNWWYISAALAFILLFPLVELGFEKVGCLCTAGVILILPRMYNGHPGDMHFLSFLPVFCFGMIFAKYDLFAKWNKKWLKETATWKTVLRLALLLVVWIVAYKLYYHLPTKSWWDVKYNMIPLITILLCYTATRLIPCLRNVLAFFVTHATNIWLIHAFIRHTYCEAFTYGVGHFALIIAILFLISLCLSIVIETLKKVLHYQELIDRALQEL